MSPPIFEPQPHPGSDTTKDGRNPFTRVPLSGWGSRWRISLSHVCLLSERHCQTFHPLHLPIVLYGSHPISWEQSGAERSYNFTIPVTKNPVLASSAPAKPRPPSGPWVAIPEKEDYYYT